MDREWIIAEERTAKFQGNWSDSLITYLTWKKNLNAVRRAVSFELVLKMAARL
jgi:hypothetical protein